MNKQEAIEKIKKQSTQAYDDFAIMRDTSIHIINQIDEPQKPVVPKFVAEWIEECKSDNKWLMYALCKPNFENHHKVSDWLRLNDGNILIFSRAWLDGYEVEQEKLYTVEIPDTNSIWGYTFLRKIDRGVIINKTDDDCWRKDKDNQLTESEIKQDFDWAWDAGFAKEVE